jgi:hypothetical protein
MSVLLILLLVPRLRLADALYNEITAKAFDSPKCADSTLQTYHVLWAKWGFFATSNDAERNRDAKIRKIGTFSTHQPRRFLFPITRRHIPAAVCRRLLLVFKPRPLSAFSCSIKHRND